MKPLFLTGLIFLCQACTTVNAQPNQDFKNKQSKLIKTGKHSVNIQTYNVEMDEKCPSINLMSKNGQNTVTSIDLCKVKIEGYRELHALKDFAFIEFGNYQAINETRIRYDIDLALLRGASFLAQCTVAIKEDTLIQETCVKVETD